MLRFPAIALAVAFAAITVAAQAPTLYLVPDGPVANLYYGNIQVKPVRLRPGTNTPITIDDTDFFVSEHYIDFLNRFADPPGMNYWVGTFSSCGTDASCIFGRRISVSAAFFIELEFQDTGSYVYRFYAGTLGRQPVFGEFMPDRQQVVGGSNLDASKAAFADAWVQRAAFLAKYPANMANDQFVNAVLQTMKAYDGVDLSSQSGTYIGQLNGGATRGQVVRQIVEDPAFKSAEYNPSFVLMQYFGYLRRDVDVNGYNFWLDVLNNKQPNNYRGMVCSFITSAEYQLRFGSTVTHTNQDCSNVH